MKFTQPSHQCDERVCFFPEFMDNRKGKNQLTASEAAEAIFCGKIEIILAGKGAKKCKKRGQKCVTFEK